MIFGIGVDFVEISRVEASISKFGERFERRMFTDAEIEYCKSMPVPAQHFAARFAAKEALLKALGTGLSHGIGWRDAGVGRLPSGQPVLHLTGAALELVHKYHIIATHVTLSHSSAHAIAMVVLETADAQPVAEASQ